MADGKDDSYTKIEQAANRAGSWLLRNQSDVDGGWAEKKGEPTSALNTAEVLLALGQLRDRLPRAEAPIQQGIAFLYDHQEKDGPDAGSWYRYLDGKPFCPDLVRTSLAVEALLAVSEPPPAAADGVRWILSRRNNDDGWGYRRGAESEVLPTCFALSALLSAVEAGLEAERCGVAIETALAFLVGRQRADGLVGAPHRLSGARTAFAAFCLLRAEDRGLSVDRSATEDAVAWLEKNPVLALSEVEESIEVDPNRDNPRADYGFLFMSEALVARVMSASPDPEKRSGQLAQEAMEALFKAMDPDGGFFGQRVFSWSTARAVGALGSAGTAFEDFPKAPRPTAPRSVGHVILAFGVLVVLCVVGLSFAGGFGTAQAVVFIIVVLASLLGYRLISEAGFLAALRSVLPSFPMDRRR